MGGGAQEPLRATPRCLNDRDTVTEIREAEKVGRNDKISLGYTESLWGGSLCVCLPH